MIRVSDLHKFYGGKRALGPVSFEIAEGETVGFLGVNGAGKTTLLRILAGDLRPSAGSVHVGDVDCVRNPYEVRKRIGFLPERPPLYPDMTVRAFLIFAGELRGMGRSTVRDRVPDVEALMHLGEVRDRPVRHLSQGFRQRVGVAQAVIHDPDVVILDEPTHDLDPVQIVEMRQMIQDLSEDHTILISSHILPEISETCDRILVVDDGVLLVQGSEDELTSGLLRTRRMIVTVRPGQGADERSVKRTISRVEGVREVVLDGREGDGLSFNVETSGDRRADVCRELVGENHGVIRLDRSRRELEELFLGLVRNPTADQSASSPDSREDASG